MKITNIEVVDVEEDWGTNPCSEIILRNGAFCNLSEVIVRSNDTLDSLKRKVRIATIIGTIQSSKTNFRYLRAHWQRNTEEERLLGVSLTGIMDHTHLSGQWPIYDSTEAALFGVTVKDGKVWSLKDTLNVLKGVAIETNKVWAKKLGINASTAITCVKPSGTVSQLVDSASGIHPRYSDYYIRTVRSDKKDPLATYMVAKGIPYEEEIGKEEHGLVFSFPIASPKGSVTREDMTALEQLELWKVYQEHWCEHKPSITVYIREDEWLEVGAWVYRNFDDVSGVSFLPYSDHTYQQAPYQPCSKEEYEEAVANMPTDIDWTELDELIDNTTASGELACTGSSCEVL